MTISVIEWLATGLFATSYLFRKAKTLTRIQTGVAFGLSTASRSTLLLWSLPALRRAPVTPEYRLQTVMPGSMRRVTYSS